ncbi:MAG: Do family serine endopeptidase [Bdellovibrionales bacterium]
MTKNMPMGVVVFAALALLSFPSLAETQREVPTSPAQVQLSYAPIVKKTAPAVVNIYTQKLVRQRVMSPFVMDPFFQHFFGGMPQGLSRQRLENSLGSGVIVKPDGLIVTSNHVIADADEITVVLADRREFPAKLLLSDDHSDLAVLKIDPKGEALPYVALKDSDDVEVGDLVIAIGNPFGVGQTVTSGIVSALARTNLDINDLNYYIQTDAAINPGNSGGALITMDGRLIGVNAAIYTKDGGNMGIGFAVPSNMVSATLAGLSKEKADGATQHVARPWTGIAGQLVTADMAKSLGLVRPMGLLVNGLMPSSPAAKAGLKIGDVITSVNGKPVEDPAAFSYRIATSPLGGEADLGVVRKGKMQIVRLPLVAPPEDPARQETAIKGRSPLAGANIVNISPAVAVEYGLPIDSKGVLIVSISPESSVAGLGIGKGDVLVSVNGEKIASVEDAVDALSQKARSWRLTFNRAGSLMTILVR